MRVPIRVDLPDGGGLGYLGQEFSVQPGGFPRQPSLTSHRQNPIPSLNPKAHSTRIENQRIDN